MFNSALTANSSDSPQVATSGNQWASFLLGALDNQTSARLVPLQTTNLRGYSAYFQDDWRVSDRLTLNLGLALGVRARRRPIPDDRLSQGLDLTVPIPEMQTTPPTMPAQAAAADGEQGLQLDLQRRLAVRHLRRPQRVGHAPGRTSCRASA